MGGLDLSGIDLNLLKAFDALAREGSVTKAAERLAIGQPAMSHALGRLRELLDDELFVKTPRGMEPTLRAQSLIAPVRTALGQISRALTEVRPFDPAADQTVFRIGMPGFIAAGILPKILRATSTQAPNVSFEIVEGAPDQIGELIDDGDVDLIVNLELPGAEWHRQAVLFSDEHFVVFDRNLVSASDPITLDEFLAVPHIAIITNEILGSVIDHYLGRLGRERRVIAATSDFLLAGYLLHEVPALATLPAGFAKRCSITSELQTCRLPFEIPQCQILMGWHAREDASPRHRWLREALTRATQEMIGVPA